jgi:uncharacterized membrane-anchored protein YitT (DUF2179 family)
MEAFTAKWFTVYYFILGFLFAAAGIGLIIKKDTCSRYLVTYAESDQPPAAIRSILKYFFLFTIPCLIFSFIPFSWLDLLFSLWSLLIVYAASLQLVHWPQTRQIFKQDPEKIHQLIKLTAGCMLAVSPAILLLGYLVIQQFALS